MKRQFYKSLLTTGGIALLTTITSLAPTSVGAQSWPSKAVTIVVPFPPGGTSDLLARTLSKDLGDLLGQSIIIENKGGAGGTLGAEQVAKARADGHTLLMGAVHHTVATSVYKKLPYDFQKDLAPISILALVPNVLVVNPGVAAKNAQELIALAKPQPGKMTYGSAGNGTLQHLIGAQFEDMTGVDILHVPYKGSGPLVVDLMSGQINMSFDTIPPVLQQIKAGKLRPLAVTTAKRSSALPDVPTLDESGLKGFDLGTWFGLLAPAGTPPAVIERISQELAKIFAKPEFRKTLEGFGADPIGNSPAQMAKQIKDDTERFAKIVREKKVVIE